MKQPKVAVRHLKVSCVVCLHGFSRLCLLYLYLTETLILSEFSFMLVSIPFSPKHVDFYCDDESFCHIILINIQSVDQYYAFTT